MSPTSTLPRTEAPAWTEPRIVNESPALKPSVGAEPVGELQVRIGEKIRKIRVDRNLTQKGFADQIQVNVSYIGPLEKGIKTPSIHTLERIAAAFSLPVSYFFLDDDDPAESESSTLYKLRALLSSRTEEERAFLYKTLVELTKVLPQS
jgi:transcriptional regulator with XRE-family HTH domain